MTPHILRIEGKYDRKYYLYGSKSFWKRVVVEHTGLFNVIFKTTKTMGAHYIFTANKIYVVLILSTINK